MYTYVYIPATTPSHVGEIHVCVQVCMRIHIYICLHVFTCMGIHIYTCIYMFIYLQPLHRMLENGDGLGLVVLRKENFSKVSSIIISYSKLSSELTFENFCWEKRWSRPRRLAQRKFLKSQIHRHFIYYIEQRASFREFLRWENMVSVSSSCAGKFLKSQLYYHFI